jgi:predicted HicB family RNase H-like nuclease
MATKKKTEKKKETILYIYTTPKVKSYVAKAAAKDKVSTTKWINTFLENYFGNN